MSSVEFSDILQEVPHNKLIEVRNVFKHNWPTSVHVYYLIDTCIQIIKQNPDEKYVTIYSPEGVYTDGTIVVIIEMFCYDVFLYTFDKKQSRLEKSLRETKMIDYSKKPLFCAMHQDLYNMVFRVRNEIGQPFPRDVQSHVWWISNENALQYEYSVPEGIFLAPLNESHVETMNEVWPHKSPGSEKYLAKLLELNGGIGLFSKENNNELCSWVVKNYFGGLGILQTAEKYKRNGYGTLIVKIFSKMLAEKQGYDLTGFVVRTNSASQNMFTKLGFKKIIPVTWLEHY